MRRKWLAWTMCVALAAPAQDETPTFRASANLVIVTVFVRDSRGRPVEGLTKDDFLVTENGKPQTVRVFEFQQIEQAVPGEERLAAEAEPARAAAPAPQTGAVLPVRYRDRRLIVLYFDWTSLDEEQQVRAKEAAEEWIRTKMTPADLVRIVAFGSRLRVVQDFTGDRDALIEAVRKFQTGEMSELAAEGATETDTGEDAAFAADETEFNVFNTDRKLAALEDLARSLAPLPEKKAVVYFSGGVSRTGMDNEAQLRAAVNAAVRANVSFYPVDVRGLQAEPPGGGAAVATVSGTGLFSGQAQGRQRQRSYDTQDTLEMLAADTGGKALFDSNDLVLGIQRAQQDIQSYYILGYYSTDERRDGQYRRVDVKLAPAVQARLKARLDYRRGYFAEKDFAAFTSYDKEKQLEEALLAGDPVTQVRLALEVNWFRLGRSQYFVPVAVKIPGSAIPLKKQGGAETTTFDFVGQVKDARGAVAATVRDAIKIQLREEKAGQLASRSLIYDTGFTLPPGAYSMRMVVRENLTGKLGSFDARFTIPDLGVVKDEVRLSSLVLGVQRVAVSDAVGAADKKLVKRQDAHPLVRGKEKLLPSVTRVFREGQTVFVYAEAYDPELDAAQQKPALAAALTVYRDGKLVFQSRPAVVTVMKDARRRAAAVALEVPLKLPEGQYMAQLNVIDRVGEKAGFLRAPLVVVR
ncbi:MAG: VWA domain-containing protein [Bryobacteraceae bacterium]